MTPRVVRVTSPTVRLRADLTFITNALDFLGTFVLWTGGGLLVAWWLLA